MNPQQQPITVQTGYVVPGGVVPPGGAVAQPTNTIIVNANTQPQQVIYQQPSLVYNNYKVQSARTLGLIQIIVGCLVFVFQIAAICVHSAAHEGGTGIWCGIVFIITGALALNSVFTKTSCMIVSTMVMSIISAVFVWSLLIASAVGLGIDNNEYCGYYDYDKGYWMDHTDCKDGKKIAMNVILLLLSVVEIVASIWQSAVCCAAVCCGNRTRNGTVIQQSYQLTAGQQIVVAAPNQQVISQTGQPMNLPPGTIICAPQPDASTTMQGQVYTTPNPTAPPTVPQQVMPAPTQQQPGADMGAMAPPAYSSQASAPPGYTEVAGPLPQKN